MNRRLTDQQPTALSALPALTTVVLVAVLAAGLAATIHWAETAPAERTLIVSGTNGPGMIVDHDHLRCRVWGTLKICASNDITWRVEP